MAIDSAKNSVGHDTIQFNISRGGWVLISLNSPSPWLHDQRITIDGRTQLPTDAPELEHFSGGIPMNGATQSQSGSDRTGQMISKCLLGLLWLAFPSLQAEGAFLRTLVDANAANFNSDFNSFSQFSLERETRFNDTNVVSLINSYSFSGQSEPGVDATMVHSVSAAAQSNFGLLRSRFEMSITNAFFDPSNPDYQLSTGMGVPDSLGGGANARFSDELTVVGNPGLTQIRLLLRMTGELSQNAPGYPFSAGLAQVFQQIDPGVFRGISRVNSIPGGSIDQLILTDPFELNSDTGKFDIGVLLGTQARFTIASRDQVLADGSDVSASVDFFNTLEIAEFQGFDIDGNSVPITSVTGDSGTIYVAPAVNPIPEPSSSLLFVIAGGVLLVIHRRTNPSTHTD